MDSQLQFVTISDDLNGQKALSILEGMGQSTRALQPGERAPAGSVALFTPTTDRFQGSKGKYLRCSSVKLTDDLTPFWARTSPFRVCIIRIQRARGLNGGQRHKYRWSCARFGLKTALEEMVRNYISWLEEGSSKLVPWSTSEKDPKIGPASACMCRIRSWAQGSSVIKTRTLLIIRRRANDTGVRQIEINQWKVNRSDRRMVFPSAVIPQALELISKWIDCFPRERTWAQGNHSIPSLFIRFDCIVRDGRLILYEIEERPAGLGVSSIVNPIFLPEFKQVAESWPQFSVVISPLRKGTDDYLWTKAVGWNQSDCDLVLVRAEPEETIYHQLESQSVSSLKQKGNKSYGERMGLWRTVSCPDELDWKSSFVLKPLQGSKLKDIEIWDPQNRPGSSIRSRVLASLSKNRSMFCQVLHPPMETGIERFPWMIFRIFFGYNIVTGEWQCLGGNWNARHNLRIHGASDALFGPAVVE